MLHLEAVGLVSFVVESFQFVDGQLVELIEVVPPLVVSTLFGTTVNFRWERFENILSLWYGTA